MINSQHDKKVFIETLVRFDTCGDMHPVSIIWRDGRAYEIDKILDKRRAASLKAGGIGLRYTIKIKNKITYLFYEGQKWYMEE
jgi:hypothetical protein